MQALSKAMLGSLFNGAAQTGARIRARRDRFGRPAAAKPKTSQMRRRYLKGDWKATSIIRKQSIRFKPLGTTQA